MADAYFWLGADGEVTECSEPEFEALINEKTKQRKLWSDHEPSTFDSRPEQLSFFWLGDEDDHVKSSN